MKNAFTLVAAAASLAPVMANWGNEFCSAPSFPCPGTSPNKCNDQQQKGWDFDGLSPGSFSNWGGFNFNNGWSCGSSKRDELSLSARTGGGRSISATCGHDAASAPSFGCGSDSDYDSFSISTIDISVEFDCRMEFHYEMPDGSQCKHTHDCAKGGTTVTNNQCGGAKKVSFVYPQQPGHSQDKCGIHVHHVGWDCDDHGSSTTTAHGNKPTTSAGRPPASHPHHADTSSVPHHPHSPPSGPAPTSSVPNVPTTAPDTSVIKTTFQSTSTIFTTSTSTIISCGPEVTSCPAHSTVVVTVTVPVSTTICPVTATMTRGQSQPTSSAQESHPQSPPPQSQSQPQSSPQSPPQSPPQSQPQSQSSAVPPPPPPASTTEGSSGASTTSPSGPGETMPCPSVVPQCLNTWLHLVKECKDNTDAACYCPSKEFVENVFECMYAHGETDDIISEAVTFFQGICANWIPSNPGIATGGNSVTSCITATKAPTQPASAVYTTVVVDTTITVPCVTGGSTIPGSSTVTHVSTAMTVPRVSIPAGATSQPVAPSTNAPGVPAQTSAAPSTMITAQPTQVGTGGLAPSSTKGAPVTGGAGHVGAGMGVGLAVLVAAVAAL